MQRVLLSSVYVIAFATAVTLATAAVPAPSLGPSIAGQSAPISLYVGEARVLNESNIKRMAVGNGRVVTVSVINASQVLLLAEGEGQSTIHLWHRDGSENDYAVRIVSANAARLLGEVRSLVGDDTKIHSRIVGDKVVIEGSDLGNEQSARLEDIAKLYPEIVNLVSHVTLDRMVETDVRIMEFRKTTLSQLGIAWSTTGVNGPSFGIMTNAVHGPGFVKTPFSAYVGLATSVPSAIDAAVNKGDAAYLSEPRLTCKSGGEAKFLAGGEVPIPLTSIFGSVSVQFKPYGVKLEVSPVVSDSGQIHLKAMTELSAIDPTVTVAGIPGFITRRTETEVNMQSDQTLVISGVFDGSDVRNLQKVPGLAEIPVLGELFKSRDFQKKKPDLVIFLTPHIVDAQSPSNLEAVKAGDEARSQALNKAKLAE